MVTFLVLSIVWVDGLSDGDIPSSYNCVGKVLL